MKTQSDWIYPVPCLHDCHIDLSSSSSSSGNYATSAAVSFSMNNQSMFYFVSAHSKAILDNINNQHALIDKVNAH